MQNHDQVTSLRVGTRVTSRSHPEYGEGTVLRSDGSAWRVHWTTFDGFKSGEATHDGDDLRATSAVRIK